MDGNNNLEEFFNLLSNKITPKISIQPPIASILSKIASSELLYSSLNFLKQRYFTRIDGFLDPTLLASLTALLESDDVLAIEKRELCRNLQSLVKTRRQLMKFYNHMADIHIKMDFVYLLSLIPKYEPSPTLGSLDSCVGLEINILSSCISSEIAIKKYDLNAASLYFFAASHSFKELQRISSSLAREQTSKLTQKQSNASDLNNWLKSFVISIQSKFALYFYNTLLECSIVETNVEPYLQPLFQYTREESKVINVSMIYMINDDVPYYEHGYHLNKGDSYVAPSGIKSFPAILSFPNHAPLSHWPNIISIIQGSQPSSDTTASPQNLEYLNEAVASSIDATGNEHGTLYNSLLTWRRKDQISSSYSSIESSIRNDSFWMPNSGEVEGWWKKMGKFCFFYDCLVDTTYILAGVDGGKCILTSIIEGKVDDRKMSEDRFSLLCKNFRQFLSHADLIKKLRGMK